MENNIMKKTTINMQNEANIKAEGKLNSKHCKPVICLETGEVFTSMTDAAEKLGVSPQNMSNYMNGRCRHIRGKHYCYLSRVNESLDAIVTRLRETAAVEEDAKKWQEYQAEQEAIRKEEERRAEEARKAEEKRQAAIVKADAKVERCRTIRDRIAAQLAEAERNLMSAEIERESLDNNNEDVA
jgi:transcriptional regulator with XRE-family HTH domain